MPPQICAVEVGWFKLTEPDNGQPPFDQGSASPGNRRPLQHRVPCNDRLQEGLPTDTSPLTAPMTRRQAQNMPHKSDSPDRRFYYLGRIIAVLELGARSHGEIRWVDLYYSFGFLPRAGLNEPLQKHRQSVLPHLERKGTAAVYTATLDHLAMALQESTGGKAEFATFNAWASQVASDNQSEALLPGDPTPEDAVLYAEGYLDQRQALQPGRQARAPDKDRRQYLWAYHLGRIMPWNGGGNDPRLPPGFQQGLRDGRAITPNTCRERSRGNALR